MSSPYWEFTLSPGSPLIACEEEEVQQSDRMKQLLAAIDDEISPYPEWSIQLPPGSPVFDLEEEEVVDNQPDEDQFDNQLLAIKRQRLVPSKEDNQSLASKRQRHGSPRLRPKRASKKRSSQSCLCCQ